MNDFIPFLNKIAFILENIKNKIIDINKLPYSIIEINNEVKIYRKNIKENTELDEIKKDSELKKGKKKY